jgi:hypothetical protein
MFRRIGSAYVGFATTLVSSLLLLLGFNAAVTAYLRGNPELLMSESDRINENTRAVREKMIGPERAREWFALESEAEVQPMWTEFYAAGLEFESYTHYRHRPVQGRYLNVTEHGFRLGNGPAPWPPADGETTVFFFGGSTAFHVGPDWASTAAYLERAMNEGSSDPRARVYNFGRSGYMSTQDQVLFEQLLRAGVVPDVAIFLHGLNDFCWLDGQPSSWQHLAGFFDRTNREYVEQMQGHGILSRWALIGEFARTLPLARGIDAVHQRVLGHGLPVYQAAQVNAAPVEAVSDAVSRELVDPDAVSAVIDRYYATARQIESVARAFGVVPVFVWQPIPTYAYDVRFHVFYPDRLYCHAASRDGYPRMAERVRDATPATGFLWAADIQRDLHEPLYVDAFHYTAPMAQRLARFILAESRSRGWLAAQAADAGHLAQASSGQGLELVRHDAGDESRTGL